MSENSLIEWTQSTWNPVTGCTPVSSGCINCYAKRLAKRLQAMGNKNYINGFDITLHENMLNKPLLWKKPRLIFVNSMSDLFHESIPLYFIKAIFEIMEKASWHTFQILTKRAVNLEKISSHLNWPKNVWIGVTIESQEYIERVDYLRNIPASVRFLSLEPLLSSIPSINLQNIDWVIVGGESGPNSRPIQSYWVENIQKICKKNCVPFFFKQWGGYNKKSTGRLLNGREYSEMPLEFANIDRQVKI